MEPALVTSEMNFAHNGAQTFTSQTDPISFGAFLLPPLETESNSFTLNARFQQREGQKIETDRTFVNFVKFAHRGDRRGKKYPFVNLENCTGKTER